MLRTLFKDFSILFLVRVLSRVIDFFLNIFVIRAIDPNIFASTVHFQLIMNVALFYTKTCLKNSYQKRAQGLSHSSLITSSTNLMLFGVPICLLISTFMVAAQNLFNDSSLNYFFLTALLYGVSSVIESLQEAFASKLVLQLNYEQIGKIEIKSLLCKSMVLWVSVGWGMFQVYGVGVFGVSQLVYSVMLAWLTWRSTNCGEYIGRKIQYQGKREYVHQNMKKSAKEFSVISFIKLVLQELEKIILVALNIPTLSSDYTLINNLGSLIPRYLFMPLQEIGFNIFSKAKQVNENRRTLITLLRILIIFGLLITVFGVCYSKNLLLWMLGDVWSTKQTVNALRVYCFYVLVMGLNGISEAFVYARIQADKMGVFRIYMVITTIIYIGACVLLLKLGLGAAGIFLASSISMMFRILVCWRVYIHNQVFPDMGFFSAAKLLIPKPLVLVTYACSFVLCWNIQDYFKSPFLNLVLGGIIFVGNLGVTALKQKDMLQGFKQLRQAKKNI